MNVPLELALSQVLEKTQPTNPAQPDQAEPQDEIILTAQRKITLQCGQSSITLHPNGKVVIRGEYIVSAATGTNRITGGQIEIN